MIPSSSEMNNTGRIIVRVEGKLDPGLRISHTRDNQYHCSICNLHFTHVIELAKHNEMHCGNESYKYTSKAVKSYACTNTVCSVSAKRKEKKNLLLQMQ